MTSANDEGPTYAIAAYLVQPTGYDDVVHPDKGLWCIRVEDAGEGWAIRRGKMCLNFRNEWEYEPPPGSRDDSFLRRCRFNEHAALLRTRRVIDGLEFDGMTFAQFVTRVHAELIAELLNEKPEGPQP